MKDFASTLVTDHTADFGQLSTAAKQANANVPNAINTEHNKMIAPFQKLKGAAFDHKYAQEMVAGHTKAIEMYKKEASDGQNDALKSYAQTALPVLEKHLTGAEDLEKTKSSESRGSQNSRIQRIGESHAGTATRSLALRNENSSRARSKQAARTREAALLTRRKMLPKARDTNVVRGDDSPRQVERKNSRLQTSAHLHLTYLLRNGNTLIASAASLQPVPRGQGRSNDCAQD